MTITSHILVNSLPITRHRPMILSKALPARYISRHIILIAFKRQMGAHASRKLALLYTRVQWFWLFFTFWGITTHLWHPKGPRIWKLAKKIFNFMHGLRKFLAKTRKCVFLVWFQSLILGAAFDRSLPFFQHVLFMASLIHIPNFRSLSQKL